MKFLCPSCKAKYQIADEKVAGRSVRMKCRKCSFMIHVTSLGASSEPAPSSSSAPPANAGSDAPPAPPPAGAKAPAKLVPPPRSPVPRAQPAPAPVTRSPSPAPGRAAQALASAPRAAVPPARPAPVRASAPAQARAVAEQPIPQDFDTDEEEEATRIADSALAGAFSQAFKQGAGERASTTELTMPADEWFVGINGVPVGPIRLSELRSKAGSGSVTKDSLVWRDGFEDWRPLKTFPELLAIVEESVSSVRASLTPLTPHVSSVTISDPFAGKVATTPAGPAPAAGAIASDDLEVAGLKRRRTPVAAWIALGIALLFGLTIGFVLFGGQKPAEPIIKYVEVPAKAAEKASTGSAEEGVKNAVEETKVGVDPKTGVKRPTGVKQATNSDPGKPESGGLAGLKGLSGLGTTGPSRGPEGSGPSGSTGGGQLDSAQVQSTVSRYTGSVKRSCWQPALDTRDKDAPTSARVVVTITVGPSGSVQNATTSGEPRGYRGLANCIASRVRGWQFPPSGESTTVNVPFVFAAQ